MTKSYEEIKTLPAKTRNAYFAELLRLAPPVKGSDGIAMTPKMAFEVFDILVKEGLLVRTS